MVDDRNRNYDPDRGSYNRDRQDYGQDYGAGRDYGYSSARDYEAAGEIGGRDDRNFRGGGTGYGSSSYGQRNFGGGGDRERYGANYGGRDYYGGRQTGSQRDQNFGGERQGNYRGSYGSDGHRFTDTEDQDRSRESGRGRDYGRQPQGYDYQDRGFFARAGDEVRSWFGDDDAERRREADQRYDERQGGYGGNQSGYGNRAYGRDDDYHNWRKSQIDALDRDYHEYRQENAKRFESEFGSWRANRQTQRTSLSSVKEHMDVVGSDGEHVGTVDKVRDDRIILTKNDADAGGRHHSIPSSWLQSVDDKVTISKTAADAKAQWRDEEQSSAMFGQQNRDDKRDDDRGTNLNRSFSGTY